MNDFELFEPASVEEAVGLLAGRRGSFVLAGGTDLLVRMKRGELAPENLISLRLVPNLSSIREEGGFLRLGACVTHRAIERSPRVRALFPALADAEESLGSIQVRNLGTIGGNLCNAAPSADTVPPLVAHEAGLRLFGPEGERRVPLEAFFAGPCGTTLKPGELLTEIELPVPPPRTSSAYLKLTRRSCMELPLLGAAVRLSLDPDGTILDGKIALSCAGPVCLRAKKAEALFPGARVEDDFLEALGRAALEEASPRESFRCSAEYRREMIPVLVGRAVRRCRERILQTGGDPA
ncbi:MAG: xanthine dehydrogenase family protein subunit M [Deltaproteobacteria bacterium]|nr:xanthine dehydrogenase family protein subunit M [Deltaproteobacteria bacterium]